MRLCDLVQGLPCVLVQGSLDVPVTRVVCDTARVVPGALFVCLAGAHTDGHTLAAEAAARGAAAVAIEHETALPAGVTVLRFAATRPAFAALAAAFCGCPARALTLVGVTGTKGKTTVAHMLASILTAGGRRVGIVGTNGAAGPGFCVPPGRTTPEADDLHALLRRMADAGCDTCVMEVSSLALKQQRTAGLRFAAGVFTNLSPDHIGPGEHPDFADYLASKAALFRQCGAAVVNGDDPHTPALLAGCPCPTVRYGLEGAFAFRAAAPALWHMPGALGVRFDAEAPAPVGTLPGLEVPMPGRFTVSNALAALAAAHTLALPGFDLAAAARAGLGGVHVRGRTEPVVLPGAPFSVILDYAHNEAAARCVLSTLRAYRPRRLVAVFGCGGSRSALRRTGMGAVCAELADFCILTEDNSRGEPRERILADIERGVRGAVPRAPYVVIPDRCDALHYALDCARPGDLIAVLGKGHETTLDRGDETIPFDERAILLEHARAKGMVL